MRYCFTTYQGQLSLIVQLSKQNYIVKAKAILNEVRNCLDELKKQGYQIEKVYYTFDDIANKEAIKVSRKYLERLINENKVQLEQFANFSNLVENNKEELNNDITNRIKKVFSEILCKDVKEIGEESDFFLDLGGTSLDYMSLLLRLEQEFETTIVFKEKSFSTVKEFYNYILSKEN